MRVLDIAEFENKHKRVASNALPQRLITACLVHNLMARSDSPAELSEEEDGPVQGPSLAYDPDQDVQEKRQIRRDYRALIDETTGEPYAKHNPIFCLTCPFSRRTKGESQKCQSVRD